MKKLTKILGVLTLLFSLFVSLGMGAKDIVEAEGTATTTDNVSVILHKKKMSAATYPEELIKNTGDVMPGFASYENMPNAKFVAYDVTTQYYGLRAGGSSAANALAAVTANPQTTNPVDSPKTTGVDGQATFVLPAKSGNKDAVYVFVETEAPAGTTKADNMGLVLPILNENNSKKTEIHLYPKNIVKADGSVTVTKLGTAHNEPLAGIYFKIKRELTQGKVEYRSATINPTTGLHNWVTNVLQGEAFVTDANGQFTVNGLEHGDYTLFESQHPGHTAIIGENATHFTIDDTHKSVELTIMNDTVDIVKEHEGDGTDYNVGDLIPYSLTFKIPQGIGYKNQYGNYYHSYLLIRDRPDTGLHFHNVALSDPDGLKVQVGTQEITVDPSWITINPSTPNGFELKIPISAVENFGGQELKVSYNMYLDKNAIPDVGYKNIGSLNTGVIADNHTGPKVFTGGKKFKKVDQNFNDINALAGAVFVVRNEDSDGAKYLKVDATTKAVSWVTALGDATTYTSDANGLVLVKGLEEGTYWLEETAAPADYVLREERAEFEVKIGEYNVTPLDVVNVRKGQLPSTGGSGIIGFIGFGAVLVASTGGYYIKRKRKE